MCIRNPFSFRISFKGSNPKSKNNMKAVNIKNELIDGESHSKRMDSADIISFRSSLGELNLDLGIVELACVM